MAVPLNASLPPDLDLGPGFTLRVTALSAADGSVVSGVNVSDFGILYEGSLPAEAPSPLPPPLPPPQPSPPPPPDYTQPMAGWTWDATKATVRPNSAALVSTLLATGGPEAYFAAEVAVAVRTASTPVYSVSTTGHVGALDPIVYVPVGTKPGLDNDHHLAILDKVTGRIHDFWRASVTAGKLSAWSGGVSFPLASVQEPFPVAGKTHVGSNAACFPLSVGAISAAELAAGVVKHALHFSINHPGPAPNPYPAAAASQGYPNPGHLPLGSWLRMNPTATLSTSATKLERVIFEALKRYGMFLRDQGATLLLYGSDIGGGGQGNAEWQAAGVTLDPARGNLAPRMTHIPWSELQALEPPAKV